MIGNYISDWVISPTISNKGMVVTSSEVYHLIKLTTIMKGRFRFIRNVFEQKGDVL